jgi:two-component system LytT family response regulator
VCRTGRTQSYLTINTGKGVVLLNKTDVLYIKADGRYSTVYCIDGKNHVVCKNIGEYESELNKDFFFRVHKSYLVNCKFVIQINSRDGDFVELVNNTEIELSKRRKTEFLEFLR